MLIVLKPKTAEEIKRHYPDQWVLLSCAKRDESGNLDSGIVLYASRDQNELYGKSKGHPFEKLVFWNTNQDPPRMGIAS